MPKKRIAVDIDDTLFAHFSELAEWHNSQFGTNLTLEHNHPKGEDALRAWKADTIEQAVRRVHEFYKTSQYEEAKPFEDALKVMARLSKDYELIIVTARDTIQEEFTHLWLSRYFTDMYKDVHFTAMYSLEGKARTKLEVFRDLNVDYVIDDSLQNCLDAAEDGRIALVYGDYPWNRQVDSSKNTIRVNEWLDIEDYFYGSES